MSKNPEYKTINYKSLLIDHENPRLPKSMHNLDEQGIIDYMLLEAATLELMQAIGENDFFRGEQLLVVPVENSKYKVLEGNRRLVSIMLLNEPELATVKKISVRQIYDEANFRPTEIPCLVFNSEDEIRKYLGFRHITGIKPWGLTEKSRYLYQLYVNLFDGKNMDNASKELAKTIGSRRDYVKRVLVSHELYRIAEDEGFYRIKDLDDTTFYVGYLADSLSRSNIASFLDVNMSSNNPLENLNKANLKELIFWFFEKNGQNKTRVKGKSDDLNKLNAILGNPIACTAFREGKDLNRAFEFTENIETVFFSNIQKSLTALEQADSSVHKMNDFYPDLDDDLVQIRKLTSKIKQAKDELLKKGIFGDGDEF
jgi:hypothetical protein